MSRRARAAAWLGGSELGLAVLALVVGCAAGLGAAGFRELIYAVTWLVTGRRQFGQQGHAASLHLPFGPWFVLLAPVAGGLLYGPLVQRYAREARGHGVPEVMVAVAENGGRIRPPVTVVKALASALCIGFGGSVGREGPIVQIGSAMASTVGQAVRLSERRLRVLVACGAAGGIAGTFNAPLTGLFFGFEIILREVSLEAIAATALAAVTADLISRGFFGSAPFLSGLPHGLVLASDPTFLLVGLLAVLAALVGFGFKSAVYGLEDAADRIWAGRSEWARPAVGGVLLGGMLLALPQMYGVGYPVMDRVVDGRVVLWLVVVLMLAKIVATGTTLAIGGSGGVFAPSLFTGACGGMAFGIAADRVFGAAAGAPAMYAVIAMGGVFAAAAQAPLTAIASVLEMTGDYTLALPVMLACGLAAACSRRLSYGSIYTTKLLRRGVDIQRPRTTGVLQELTVGQVMMPLPAAAGQPGPGVDEDGLIAAVGTATGQWQPQALFAEEGLEQALRQLVLYGRDGLPVVTREGGVEGWITRNGVLRVLDRRLRAMAGAIEAGAIGADLQDADPAAAARRPPAPLAGRRVVELTVAAGAAADGRPLGGVLLPAGFEPVAATEGREIVAARPDLILRAGDRLILLAPLAG